MIIIIKGMVLVLVLVLVFVIAAALPSRAKQSTANADSVMQAA